MSKNRSDHSDSQSKSFYRVGEVARLVHVKTYVLRYWETEFEQLRPGRGKTGQRFYDRKQVDLVRLIGRLLHGERYTIEGARKVLADLGGDWARGLEMLRQRADADPAQSAAKAAEEKELNALRRKVDSLAEALERRTREVRDARERQSRATQELVAARSLLDDMRTELMGLLAVAEAAEEKSGGPALGGPAE